MAAEPLVILRLAGLAALATTIAAEAHAGTSTIGRTWSIAEPDALTEIEGRVARQPVNIASRFGPRSGWTAMQAANLAPTIQPRVRSVVPFHTLEFDIRGADGRILYPKGFTFNPLDYVLLPQRLLVVAPRDLGWALGQATPTDFILLTGGDALALSETVGRPLFLLEERVKDRLGLTHAPVIVRQVGHKLELTEVRLDRAGAVR